MTPAEARDLKPVYDAFCEGKTIQYCPNDDPSAGWSDYVPDDATMLAFSQYYQWRIKPNPTDYWICASCHRMIYRQARLHCGKCSQSNIVHVREVLP